MAFLSDPNFKIDIEAEGVKLRVRPLSSRLEIERAQLLPEVNRNIDAPEDWKAINAALDKLIRLYDPTVTDDVLDNHLNTRSKFRLLASVEKATSLSDEDKESFQSAPASAQEPSADRAGAKESVLTLPVSVSPLSLTATVAADVTPNAPSAGAVAKSA